MSRQKKAPTIEYLKGLFSKCSIGILTDYRGLSAPEITNLRRRLRELGIDYKVVKNTLARFAVERAGKNEFVNAFEGPTAIAFGYGDIVEPVRALDEYIRTSKTSLNIKGGFLSDKLLTLEEVITLSKLPSREILLARILGGMQTPILALHTSLTTPMMRMIGVLQAIIRQLEAK